MDLTVHNKKNIEPENSYSSSVLPTNECHDIEMEKYHLSHHEVSNNQHTYENTETTIHQRPIQGFKDDIILPVVEVSSEIHREHPIKPNYGHNVRFCHLGENLIYEANRQLQMINLFKLAQWFCSQELKSYPLMERQQQLLVPESLEFNRQTLELLLSIHRNLLDYGIDFSQSSDTHLLLRKVPKLTLALNYEKLLTNIAKKCSAQLTKENIFEAIALSVVKDTLTLDDNLNLLTGVAIYYEKALREQELIIIIDEKKMIKMWA